MHRVLCHILVFLLCVGGLSAQTVVQDSAQMVQSTQASVRLERTAWNTVHLELLGVGFLYSLSYEGFFSEGTAIRFGAGWSPSTLFVPLTFSGFIGDGEHRCEIGAGGVYLSDNVGGFLHSNSGLYWALRIGYRYQPLKGGFNFAITFTPTEYFPLWGGISLGWGF
jgi:hypothetical protein